MQDTLSPQSCRGLDLKSMLLGIGTGILATMIFATYKQREFDQMVRKSRQMASSAGEFVDHLNEEAHTMTSNIAHAAQEGMRTARKGSMETIEAVRRSLAG